MKLNEQRSKLSSKYVGHLSTVQAYFYLRDTWDDSLRRVSFADEDVSTNLKFLPLREYTYCSRYWRTNTRNILKYLNVDNSLFWLLISTDNSYIKLANGIPDTRQTDLFRDTVRVFKWITAFFKSLALSQGKLINNFNLLRPELFKY